MQFTSTALIGREDDLEALRDALRESVAGSTRTVVVSGEAGIGKTRLVAEFLAAAGAGAGVAIGSDEAPATTGAPEGTGTSRGAVAGEGPLVLRGQCIDLDRDAPPYAPILAPLRALSAALGRGALLEAAGPARDSLAVLLPELAEPLDRGAEPSHLRASEPARRGGAEQLLDAVASTLENAARVRPLVIVIEDLHWADQATLGLLRFLVRVVESARILLVVTYRSDELGRGHPLRSWLPELDRSRRVSRLDLARLNRRQVRQLSTALLGTPLDAHDLGIVVQRTDGVPFFIEEIVGCDFAGVDAFPETLRDIVLARYETLGDRSQRLLRLLAAGGVRVEHELLVRVSEGPAVELDDAAREAVLANVLVVDGTAYAFRHALVREAIHDELLPGERMRFHTAYAEALEERRSGPGADSTAISYHWMAAHNLRAAFASSLAAMEEARASYANATAARMGERALELWEQVPDAETLAGRSRVELLGETAYILRNAGESERAIALIDEAIAGSGPEHPEQLARLLRNKASFLANIGHTGSIELLRRALEVIEGLPRSVLRANVLGELAARLMLAARFADAVATAELAFAEAESVGSRARMSVASSIRGVSRLSLGGIESGLADLAAAGVLAEGNDSARLRYWVNESDAFFLLGRYDDAIRVAESGFERARARGVERTSGVILMSNVIAPLFALGQTRRATELLDRALELEPPIGFSAHLQLQKLQAVLRGGDAVGADRLLRGWRAGLSLQCRIDAQSRLGFAAIAAEIALANGDIAGAWLEAAAIVAPEHRTFPAYDLPLLVVAAGVLAAARASGTELAVRTVGSGTPEAPLALRAHPAPPHDGVIDLAELESRLRSGLEMVRHWPTAPVFVALFEAELGGAGAGTDADLWAAAVDAATASGAPAAFAPYALVRHAEALAGSGDRAAARLRAEEARSAAEAIGMGLVTARVAELERRIGLVRLPGRRDADGAQRVQTVEDELTERERQVLALIAQGQSNKQIAQALYISVKTASVHVSNILRKTNTASRTEAAYLARSFAEETAQK
ncbi:AAA family ATPase [Herbiconiux sp. 11R-BC]|uniref:helix-turn-helix transcriptional regulator n=1 Tax=Herbiconiux sp. 11R-BC TaxID=3111637 RepID=UPI003C02D2A5